MQKLAVVTGGTGGIGTEICKSLYKQDRMVIATYRPGKEGVASAWQKNMLDAGYDVNVMAVDVCDYTSCENFRNAVVSQYGEVDILVNNAGITQDSSFRKMTEEHWSSVLRTNLDSHFFLCKMFFTSMCENGWGRIVNISSINGLKGQFGQANYSAAKAGVIGFTKALAYEGAKKSVTVNTVSPGYINTDMVAKMPESVIDKLVSDIPVGRLGEPEEVARCVAFLTSEESSFITGSNISINGGQYMS